MSEPTTSPRSTWRDAAVLAAGLGWMLAFGGHFFAQRLPNNPEYRRSELLANTHWLLLENISPSEPDPARPSGWRYFPERLDALAVAVVVLSGAWGLGHLLLRGLGLREHGRSASRTAWAFGLGLSAWSLITLGLGLCGALWRPLVIGLIGAVTLAECAFRLWDALPFGSRGNGTPSESARWTRRRFFQGSLAGPLVVLAVAPFVLAMLLGALLPPTDFDVKEYHLQGPKEWYLAGRISFLPHNVYTSFPFLTEMLSLLAMVVRGDWFRGALAGQVVLMAFGPLTACAVFGAALSVSRRAGWLAVLVLLTTPWIYRISVIAYAEGGLTFYLAATLSAVLQPPARSGAGGGRQMLLCGLLAGSAAACKYPGAVSVVIPLGAALLLRSAGVPLSGGWARVLRPGLLFASGVFVTFGPWALKNLCETGNPVYPLLYSVFGGRDWDEELNQKWKKAHSPQSESFRPDRIIPSLAMHANDIAVMSDWQSALVFGLAPLVLFRVGTGRQNVSSPGDNRAGFGPPTQSSAVSSRSASDAEAGGSRGPAAEPARGRIIGCVAYAAWLFLTWWALTHRIDRFWVPMLPVLCLLAGLGLDGLLARADRLRSRSPFAARAAAAGCALAIVPAVAFNLAIDTSPLGAYNAYLLRSDVAELETMTQSMALLNRYVPADAHVLLIGEAEVFDGRFVPFYNTVFDRSLFQQWTGTDGESLHDPQIPLRSEREIRETLRDHGITHVFVNWLEILRYREPGSYGFPEYVTPRRIRQLADLGILEPVALRPEQRLAPLDALSPGKQLELHRWAPELQFAYGAEPAVVAYQLFKVADPTRPPAP